VVIKKANTGFGATVKDGPETGSDASGQSGNEEDVLPEWARGTNASTELCSD
jgi:hypothetical protein